MFCSAAAHRQQDESYVPLGTCLPTPTVLSGTYDHAAVLTPAPLAEKKIKLQISAPPSPSLFFLQPPSPNKPLSKPHTETTHPYGRPSHRMSFGRKSPDASLLVREECGNAPP